MPIRALRRRHGRLETLGCELGIVRVGSVVLCIDDTGALVASGGFRLWIQADSHQRRFFDILAAPPVCRRLIHTAGILTNCAARSKASRRCSNLVSIRSSLFGQPQIMSANRANARVHVGRSGSESYRRLLRPGHESSPVSSARPPSSSTRAPKRFTSTREETRTDVLDYLQDLYNPTRRYLTLLYISTAQFEAAGRRKSVSTEPAATHVDRGRVGQAGSAVMIIPTPGRTNAPCDPLTSGSPISTTYDPVKPRLLR